MAGRDVLRMHGKGAVDVAFVREFLEDLEYAYAALSIFEYTLGTERFSWLARDLRSIRTLRSSYFPFPFPFPSWPLSREAVLSFVAESDTLILQGARLQSPGFWDFLGKLNPLEVMREYLNDRHERRKDRDYRERAEKEKLWLDNLRRKNTVVRERIELARQLGATEQDLAPLLKVLVHEPLQRLDKHQDRGVLEYTEWAEQSTKDR